MNPYYTDASVTVYAGDCLDVMRELPDASVDAVVTDPPYDLTANKKGGAGAVSVNLNSPYGRARIGTGNGAGGFMGKDWDSTGIAFDPTTWREVLRVLKPGGHLLAFGGTRTYHRLACAVEDAGFEIRDSISWLYGSGFPKSLDVSKAIDKAAGLAGGKGEMKRGGERLLNQTTDGARSGTGTWGNESGRSAYTYAPEGDEAKRWAGWGTALKPAHEPIVVARKPLAGTVAGNVAAHGTGALNIDGCRVAYEEGGTLATNPSLRTHINGGNGGKVIAHEDERRVVIPNAAGRWPTNVLLDQSQADALDAESGYTRDADTYGDSGGASRFFPTFRYEAKAPQAERPRDGATVHPTVKPLDLMRWLVRLVTPHHGVVLDPFLGSGTTAEACVLEHLRCIGIEREADYLPLIVARLGKPLQVGFDFGGY